MQSKPRLISLTFCLFTGRQKETDGQTFSELKFITVDWPDDVGETLWLRLQDALTVEGVSFNTGAGDEVEPD